MRKTLKLFLKKSRQKSLSAKRQFFDLYEYLHIYIIYSMYVEHLNI